MTRMTETETAKVLQLTLLQSLNVFTTCSIGPLPLLGMPNSAGELAAGHLDADAGEEADQHRAREEVGEEAEPEEAGEEQERRRR